MNVMEITLQTVMKKQVATTTMQVLHVYVRIRDKKKQFFAFFSNALFMFFFCFLFE